MLFIVVSGMVPCPGAAAIFILALSVNAVLRGVLAVLAMSLGMATVLAAVAMLTTAFRGSMLAALARSTPARRRVFEVVLGSGGALLMVCFGLLMLLPTL
jgi:ABC-type nickel/cobalt efflux system permease component RcnA